MDVLWETVMIADMQTGEIKIVTDILIVMGLMADTTIRTAEMDVSILKNDYI